MTRRPIVLIAEANEFSTEATGMLRQVADVRLEDLSREQLLQQLEDVDVLWVRLRYRIDREVFEAAPRLGYLVTATTGLNHVDLEEAAAHDVRVVSLRDNKIDLSDVRGTAEHTVALMLSLLRSIPEATRHTAKGGWNRDSFKGREIFGKTVGIIGYGRLGRLVARYLEPFGARIVVSDPNVDSETIESARQVRSLDQLLAESDVVTLHASYRAGNEGLVGRGEFGHMKSGSWFINTARGELVDEDALLEALQSGHLAGAAIDVLADEQVQGVENRPLVEYARTHGNLLITPHIGGCTFESMAKTETAVARRLVELLQSDVKAEGVSIP